jgi:hypothetical protein
MRHRGDRLKITFGDPLVTGDVRTLTLATVPLTEAIVDSKIIKMTEKEARGKQDM